MLFNSAPVCGGSVHRDGCRMRVSYLIVLAKETLQGQRASILHHLPNCPLLYSSISLISLSCSLVPFKSTPAFSSFGLFLIFLTLCLSVSGSLPHPPSCQSNAPSPPSLLSGLRRERRAAVAAAASQDVFFWAAGGTFTITHIINAILQGRQILLKCCKVLRKPGVICHLVHLEAVFCEIALKPSG